MLVDEFADYLKRERRCSGRTVTAYRSDLQQFCDFYGIEGKEEEFARVTVEDVRAWLAEGMRGGKEGKRKLSAASGKRKLSSLKAFFRYLEKRGVVRNSPAEDVSGPKLPKRLPVFVPEKEMEEAAQVDGVNDIQLFSRIILPMSKPVLAAIGLFTVVGNWNDWFTAFLYIDQEHSNLWPLQTYIMLIFNNLNMLINPELAAMLDSVTTTESVNDLSTRMALTFVAILPMLIIYPFFQKYFTKGVYLGAVKG